MAFRFTGVNSPAQEKLIVVASWGKILIQIKVNTVPGKITYPCDDLSLNPLSTTSSWDWKQPGLKISLRTPFPPTKK